LEEIFEKDLNTKVYSESSKIHSRYDPDNINKKIRLVPYTTLNNFFKKDHALLIIAKPLVESQNILELLEYFEGSKAIWMFWHYKAVASSNLNYFGIKNGINNLRPIVENNPNN